MHQHTKVCSFTTSTNGVMGKNMFSHIAPWWKKMELDRNSKGVVHIRRWVPWSVERSRRRCHFRTDGLTDAPTDWRKDGLTVNGKTISPQFLGKRGDNQSWWNHEDIIIEKFKQRHNHTENFKQRPRGNGRRGKLLFLRTMNSGCMQRETGSHSIAEQSLHRLLT
jgi:hypothetical protein